MPGKYIKQAGFAMLEVLLSIAVIAMASVGVFWLFSSGTTKTGDNQLTNELMAISSAYSSLLSSNLTGGIDTQKELIALLQNSGQLANNYFVTSGSGDDITTSISSPFGVLSFGSISPVGFNITVPYGYDKSCEQAEALYNSMSNVYSCKSGCSNCGGAQSYQGEFTLGLDLSS